MIYVYGMECTSFEEENMKSAVIVKGRLSDARHIELQEPLTQIEGDVEVLVFPVVNFSGEGHEDILDFISHLAPGRKSKGEIDGLLNQERAAWERH